MIAQGAPRVIHSDSELETYTEALFQLTAMESPTPAEEDAVELLTLLIERYEPEHFPIPAAGARSVVRFLLEQQHLTQRDLIPQFGAESAVSMFLAGKRKLTLKQVKRPSVSFRLPADVFLQELNARLGA
jgi:HTH-type transcriptional regulator/antitoxin HigA